MRALQAPRNPHLIAALLAGPTFHLALLFFTFKRTYDAYVHIFFADHYLRAWFDHWEYRWYTGFTMTSYPPGSHQSVALLAHFVGLQNAYIAVQIGALLLLIVGVYRFSRLWVDEEAAGYAALLAAFAPSITETVHLFGQLPTTFSLAFLLNALPFVAAWMREGRVRPLLIAWLLNAATTAGHHVTTLFGAVFFVAPVMALVLAEALRRPLPDEPGAEALPLARGSLVPLLARYSRRLLPPLSRGAIYGAGLIAILLLVVLPYWLWSGGDPIVQVSIPHASRDSFLQNRPAGIIFWIVPYGLALPLLPYLFYKGFSTRAWPLALSLTLLFVLGTGGTTPIPRLLLRGAFDILTLDRFTFWATIALLPFGGAFVHSLRAGRLARVVQEQVGSVSWLGLQGALAAGYLIFTIFTANLSQFRRFQPDPIDPTPIVQFLEKDQHERWRYLPLGFGDQMAWLAAQTTATTVDGNYHSVRRLPELTTTPVERLEGAKFRGIRGIGSLQQFLTVPDKYHLKYVFSNDQFYDPLLFFSGWHRLGQLENGIVVWEREDIPPLPEVLPRREIPLVQRLMWGIIPIGSIAAALVVMAGLFAGVRLPKRRGQPESRGRAAGLRQRLDHSLRRDSAPPPLPGAPYRARELWWDTRALPSLPRPATPARKQARSGLLLATGALLLLLALAAQQAGAITPEAVLTAYYDDLDFRRFHAAYDRLDPVERPPFEEFQLQRSVQGGLMASYASLDQLRLERRVQEEGYITLHARASWVTSLQRYETEETHVLVRREGRWRIVPPPPAAALPPDPFIRRREVAFHAQERRRVTGGTTAFADVQDRPEIEVLSARLVEAGGRYHVVGELVNADVDPADVTVRAVLFGADGRELAWFNARDLMVHKLLPREVTPFRVDFEGVAGAALADAGAASFDPEAFTPPSLLDAPYRFEIHARAVVTGRALFRDLGLEGLAAEQQEDTLLLSGQVINSGTREATIPHVLVTFYDQAGDVAWVTGHYLPAALRPQRSSPFELDLIPDKPVNLIAAEGGIRRNALQNGTLAPEAGWLAATDAERLTLPAGSPFAAYRATVHFFAQEGE